MWKFQRESIKFVIFFLATAQGQWGGIQNSEVVVGGSFNNKQMKVVMDRISKVHERLSQIEARRASQLIEISMKLQMLENQLLGIRQNVESVFQRVESLRVTIGKTKTRKTRETGVIEAPKAAEDGKASAVLKELIDLGKELNLTRTESARNFKWLSDQVTSKLKGIDLTHVFSGVFSQLNTSLLELPGKEDQDLAKVLSQLTALNGKCASNQGENIKLLESLQGIGPSLIRLTNLDQTQNHMLSELNDSVTYVENTYRWAIDDVIKTALAEAESVYFNCEEAMKYNGHNGVYSLRVWNRNVSLFKAYCLQDPYNRGEAWTLIQRREINSTEVLDFKRNWLAYKEGFGDLQNEHWLGLDHIFWLTNASRYQLWIRTISEKGTIHESYHDNFKIANEAENFKIISLGINTGTDNMKGCVNVTFNTFDRGNQNWVNNNGGAGFWGPCKLNFNAQTVTNGVYGIPIYMDHFPLRYMHFAIRPVNSWMI